MIERDYTAAELDAFKKGGLAIGLTLTEVLTRLGGKTCDVYLNGRVYWKNIPIQVWEFYLGGFQVIKKWLSYRESKILGRPINIAEADHVRDMARRLSAICLIGPRLDENYVASKAAAYEWQITNPAKNSKGALVRV